MKALLHSALAATLLAACGPAASAPLYMSEKDEIELGARANQQILQQYHVYNDPELQSYVQYVGNQLAAKSDRPGLTYHFTVLDSPEVNAFALPGGYVYITRGIMSYLNSEAELAAVLGHEIGHICARHAIKQQNAAQLANLGTALGAAFIPGISGVAASQMGGLLGSALLSGYGRDQELEADRLGAEYMARTGYDTGAMLDVLRTLKNQELFELKLARTEHRQPHVYHGLFASHPDNDTRLQEALANARHVSVDGSARDGRDDYLQRINGMVFGVDNSQGIVRGRDFYMGALGFAMRFPQGWSIHVFPGRIIVSEPRNAAAMQLTPVPADPRLTPGQFMEQRMGLKDVRNGQDFYAHGFTAHTGTAVVNTASGRQSSRLTVIYFGNWAFILAGITREPGTAAHFDDDFLDTAKSFRALSLAERQVAGKVERISLLRADAATSFEQLAKDTTVAPFPDEQLRLLNGQYPRGSVTEGQLLKTVQ